MKALTTCLRTLFACRLCLSTLVLCGLLGSLVADACYGQTPFALKNIGQNNEVSDARMQGRGGWGLTVQDTLTPGFKNLAGLAGIEKMTIQLTGFGQRVSSESPTAERVTFRTYAPNVRVAFPMFGTRAAATAGFRVRRSSAYRTQRELTTEILGEEVGYYELFVREGTQFEVPLGVAAQLTGGLALGMNVNLVYGAMIETLDETFWETMVIDEGLETEDERTAYPYVRSRRELKDIFNGASATLSALWNPVGDLKFGATYTTSHDVETERTLAVGSVADQTSSLFTMRMPVEWSVGTQIPVRDRWLFGADIDFQKFSELRGRWEWERDMEDEWTFSCGFERVRAQQRNGGASNLPLRLGFSRRNWGYRVNGHQIVEQSVSVGTGFPLRRQEGQVDVAATYGIIGNTDDHGSSSRFVRFSLTVTGLERWW